MDSPTSILIAAALATAGWVYAARRSRTLSRKQHTINVMLQASFNKEFNEATLKLTPIIKQKKVLDLNKSNDGSEEREAFRKVTNHFEFIAAGIRNGDFDEKLVRDCQRGQIIELYDKSSEYIWTLRDCRRRQTIYEHLDWLYRRWEKAPPSWWQRIIEKFLNRPLPSRRTNPHR